MPLRIDTTHLNEVVDSFRSWSRWPGRDEAKLRMLVEGNGVRTTLLYADTGAVPEVEEHPHSVERMWIDISGYVLEIFVDIEDGLLNIESIDETSALITHNQQPFIHLVQQNEQPALASIVIGLECIPRLSQAEIVTQMAFVDVNDCSGIEAFQNLERLSFRAAVWLTDLTPLATLKHLYHLNLQRSRRLEDLSPLAECTSLRWLNIQNCERIVSLEALRPLRQLEVLNAYRLPLIEDLSPFSNLQKLRELYFSRCRVLSDLSPLSQAEALEIIVLATCEQITDISPLIRMPHLRVLDLDGCVKIKDLSPLQSAHKLEKLDISRCISLTDISPLKGLQGLRELNMMTCDGVVDLSPIANIPNLESLDISGDRNSGSTRQTLEGLQGSVIQKIRLTRCTELTDISALAEVPDLNRIDAVRCEKLEDIQSIEGLPITHIDVEGSSKLTSLSVMSRLPTLEFLCINDCIRITSLHGLEGATELQKLEMSNCPLIDSLKPLENLPLLESIELKDCPELALPVKWATLWSLNQLTHLRGAFPSVFVTHLLASLAIQRRDASYIERHMTDWIGIVRESPEYPNILSSVGQCASIIEGCTFLEELLTLSLNTDAKEVSGLYSSMMTLHHLPEIEDMMTRALRLDALPPTDSIQAFMSVLPMFSNVDWVDELFPSFRDRLISRMITIIKEGSDSPSWQQASAQALRQYVDGQENACIPNGFQSTEYIEEAILSVLSSDHALAPHVFDSLATYHGRQENLERAQHLHTALLEHVFDLPESNARISAVINGLARSNHVEWAIECLDALLERAAHIDPDISGIEQVTALAYARMNHWTLAGHLALNIARPVIRNQTLQRLSTDILESVEPHAVRHAIDWLSAINDPVERFDALKELGQRPETISDAIAYTQCLSLLTERPALQRQLIEEAISVNPSLASIEVTPIHQPITQREQALVNAAFERGRAFERGESS